MGLQATIIKIAHWSFIPSSYHRNQEISQKEILLQILTKTTFSADHLFGTSWHMVNGNLAQHTTRVSFNATSRLVACKDKSLPRSKTLGSSSRVISKSGKMYQLSSSMKTNPKSHTCIIYGSAYRLIEGHSKRRYGFV